MARARWCGDEVYEAADSFKERCLRRDSSLFEPRAEIWTAANVDETQSRVGVEDLGKGSFIEKLWGQLDGLSGSQVTLGAELLYVLLLPELDTGGDKKREHLQAIIGMLSTPIELPADLDRALDAGGVANFAAAKAHRDAHLRFLAKVCARVKEMSAGERDRVLDDPWNLRALVDEVRTTTDGMQANALLHLLYPETFEYMVSNTHREWLVSAFADNPDVAEIDDVDRKIARIRELAGRDGELDFDLYEDPFQRMWKGESGPGWPEATKWSRLLYERDDFDETERTSKLEVAERVAAVRDALLSGAEDWPARLRKAFGGNNNLTAWLANPVFLDWCKENEGAADRILQHLWRESEEPDLRAFLEELPKEAVSGPGTRLSIASFLLLGVDSARWPFFKPTLHRSLLGLLGEEDQALDEVDPEALIRPEQLAQRLGLAGRAVRQFLRDRHPRAGDEHGLAWYLTDEQAQSVVDHFADDIDRTRGEATYARWTATLEELRLRMLAAGSPIRDLLDAQGLAWWLTKAPIPDDWSAERRTAFEAFRRGQTVETDGRPPPPPPNGLLPAPTASLAGALHLPESWLANLFGLLEDKRQVILYGPPGTGKTFIAQRVGEHLVSAGGSVRLVQFHPSYTYEDFFEGYRPSKRDGDGGLSFDLAPGALRTIAAAAANAPDKPHVLIIDEINRGNIAKIFGELYFLLEYRDQAMALQYSPDEEFSLPPNLYVVGTMNTADRSIALVDSALRRRFYFLGLLPTRAPIAQVLRHWLEAHGLEPEPADLLDALNASIADEDFSIGPSYLMTSDGSSPDLRRVWTHAILPLLEEHFYGTDRDVEQDFSLAAVRKRIAAEADTVTDDALDDPA